MDVELASLLESCGEALLELDVFDPSLELFDPSLELFDSSVELFESPAEYIMFDNICGLLPGGGAAPPS